MTLPLLRLIQSLLLCLMVFENPILGEVLLSIECI